MSRVTVQLPPPLRPFADEAAELRVEAHSVAEALARTAQRYCPGS